ncbi:MAG: ribbon-helix-helix protein, CopG family [Candidatus Dormibacteria bacterium]|nr:MAG: hypothetical protein DLM70_02570 [Chloroflexota bacterium]
MTDAEAEAWADRFEGLQVEDLGPGRAGPGFRGRPSLGEPKQHSPKVQARLPQPLYDKLDRRARATGRTVSAVLREAIEKL